MVLTPCIKVPEINLKVDTAKKLLLSIDASAALGSICFSLRPFKGGVLETITLIVLQSRQTPVPEFMPVYAGKCNILRYSRQACNNLQTDFRSDAAVRWSLRYVESLKCVFQLCRNSRIVYRYMRRYIVDRYIERQF